VIIRNNLTAMCLSTTVFSKLPVFSGRIDFFLKFPQVPDRAQNDVLLDKSIRFEPRKNNTEFAVASELPHFSRCSSSWSVATAK
jgi:hypothetical protein